LNDKRREGDLREGGKFPGGGVSRSGEYVATV